MPKHFFHRIAEKHVSKDETDKKAQKAVHPHRSLLPSTRFLFAKPFNFGLISEFVQDEKGEDVERSGGKK